MTTIDPEQAAAISAADEIATEQAGREPPPAPAPAGVAPGTAGHPEPVTGAARWRDVAVGAAFKAEEATTELIIILRRAAARRGQWAAELAERGAVEQARIRRNASAAAQSAVLTAATSPLVDRIVDAQLERVLRPVVLAVLDDVLRLLEQEPERIQALIRGQRESMVDELVGRIRTGAATGDTAVDRLTYRMFRRGPRPAPPPVAGT